MRWGRTSTSTSIPSGSWPRTRRRSARKRWPRGAPANERAYVDALLKRYSNDPKADLKALAVDYKNAMADLAKRYPNDLDAATLYAESLMNLHPWQLWKADGTPTEGTEEIVSVLESVLKRDSMHIGANHYYIHAVEASKTPDRALPSARRLDTLVPAAGHLVHMPAHIYMRTGNYEGAVTANAKAADVDREYIEATGAGGVYPLMYYNHNLDFLASAAMMSGQFSKASSSADALVANVLPAVSEMAMIEPFGAKKLYVLLRFARWDDVMRLPAPDPKHALLTMLSHFGRGIAQAARGNAADAEREREAYRAAQKNVSPDFDWGYNKARNMFVVSNAVLDAWIARAKRDDAAADRGVASRRERRGRAQLQRAGRLVLSRRVSRSARRSCARSGTPRRSRRSATTWRATRRTAARCSGCGRRCWRRRRSQRRPRRRNSERPGKTPTSSWISTSSRIDGQSSASFGLSDDQLEAGPRLGDRADLHVDETHGERHFADHVFQ